MATPRNKQSFLSAFQGFDATLKTLFVDQPKAWAMATREKLKDLPRTNFDLGCDFAERGQWKDAAFRFRVALYLKPQFSEAHYNLGCCQMQLGQRAQARQSFLTALKQDPGNTDAVFMLSAVDPNAVPQERRPQRMPMTMVQQFFGALAPRYDAIEASNNYQAGGVVHEALKPLLGARNDLVVVDLGAGTGLASRPFRPLAKTLVAVEFVAPMAEAARLARVADAPLFDRVLEEDIADPAASAAPLAEADLVLAVNALQFLGNLQPFFMALGQKLKPGALVALTVEPFAAPAGYGVNIETGRFGHHPEYIKLTAKNAGLALKQENRVQLYPNFNAQLFVFGK